MNYLGHAYLSFEDPEILTGNLISDFVKGKKKYDYPGRILAGIDLHRAIDTYTDQHAAVKEAGKIFKPFYGLYSSAFMDVVFDHFLALEMAKEGEEVFREFTQQVYHKVERFSLILPSAFRSIFPYMKGQDWLFNYQFHWGMEKSFEGLVHRAKYLSESGPAMQLFQKQYKMLEITYKEFFPDLRNYALKKFSDIH